MDLTVLIPTLDEEKGLAAVLPLLKEALAPLVTSYEILVVDGGSSDRTAQVARAHGARLIRQRSPGYGGALRDGFAEARGEFVLVMDADGSHPPSVIPSLWERRQGSSVVIASRYVPGGSAEMPLLRRFLSRLLNLACRRFLGWGVADSSSGLRLYRAGALQGIEVLSRDFSVQQEVLAKILKAGGTATEVPFRYAARVGGRSKARVFPLGLSYLRMLLELRLLLRGGW